jgi:hypothetical protein
MYSKSTERHNVERYRLYFTSVTFFHQDLEYASFVSGNPNYVPEEGSTIKREAAPSNGECRTRFLCKEPNTVADLRGCFSACYSLSERHNIFKPFPISGIASACLSLRNPSQAHVSDNIGFVALSYKATR